LDLAGASSAKVITNPLPVPPSLSSPNNKNVLIALALLFPQLFNADPNQAFHLQAEPDPGANPDPDTDQWSQTNAAPCGPESWSDFKVTK
jgi:hypothetical protein